MTVTIEVFSDYVCPFCFIAERPLRQAIEGKDVHLVWRPFELRPSPCPTLKPEDDYLQRTWLDAVDPLAEEYGVSIKLPDVSPQPYTHLAFEGFQYAQLQGLGDAYTMKIFEAFFQQNKDIGKTKILKEAAAEIGLDSEDFEKALLESRFRSEHAIALEEADHRDITAVPTFIIGGQKVTGLRTKEGFERFIEEAMITG